MDKELEEARAEENAVFENRFAEAESRFDDAADSEFRTEVALVENSRADLGEPRHVLYTTVCIAGILVMISVTVATQSAWTGVIAGMLPIALLALILRGINRLHTPNEEPLAFVEREAVDSDKYE